MGPTFPTFDVAEMAEEACERAGVEFRSGYALRSARRSIELLSIEWGNRGLNLWTIEQGLVGLAPFENEYPLPDDTIDLIEHSIRWYDSTLKPHDLALPRYSISEYETIPTKLSTGRPSLIHIRRKIAPTFVLWPVPDRNGYTLHYNRLRRMGTVTTGGGTHQGGTGVPELPFRFIPAMIAGLAYYMALKSTDPGAQQRVPMLKSLYEEAFTTAGDEDRDRASVKWQPWGYTPL